LLGTSTGGDLGAWPSFRLSRWPELLMRSIVSVQLDTSRPALLLTRSSKLHLLSSVTVAPITTTIRGITSEVTVGPRNGLDQASVVSCDNIITVSSVAVGHTIGAFFDDQEPTLAQAISDAFDLYLA
jgi:mRNA interferase MazF